MWIYVAFGGLVLGNMLTFVLTNNSGKFNQVCCSDNVMRLKHLDVVIVVTQSLLSQCYLLAVCFFTSDTIGPTSSNFTGNASLPDMNWAKFEPFASFFSLKVVVVKLT